MAPCQGMGTKASFSRAVSLQPGGQFRLCRACRVCAYVVVSENGETQHRPQNALVLIIRTPKKVPLILGNPHVFEALTAELEWFARDPA